MTKGQIAKLDRLIGRLEALQNEGIDARVNDKLSNAKRFLMDALKAAQKDA